MNMKKLAAGFATVFAMAIGSGVASAETPKVGKGHSIEMPKPATENFNDHSKAVVLERNTERDVRNELILIKEENGRYLFHVPNNMYNIAKGEGVGRLTSYSKDEAFKEFDIVTLEGIRTLEQYKADAALLAKTPGLGPKLADNAFDMRTRLKDIDHDLKAAGEAPAAPATKNKLSL